MSYKDGIKQLIGGGMDAYHQRAKQRIEEVKDNNIRQNHKISMLVKELDNDYLEKTEEGSVISLDHSKEGMVFVDGLEGNTLVNYCTDGSKELTLNGDIDTEGTFVTTTEGVDGGMVDVLCEGNTLVNLFESNAIARYQWIECSSLHQEITNRTISIINICDKLIKFQTSQLDNTFGSQYVVNANSVYVVTIPSDRKFRMIQGHFSDGWTNSTEDVNKLRNGILVLEGDRTNKEIPPYFEGMKSVGEGLDKFEILSQNKNEWRGKTQYTNNNATILTHEDNECIFEHKQINQGLRVDIEKYEGKEMVLSYNVELLDGSTLNWGGHSRHTQIDFLIDGVSQGRGYHNGTPIALEKGRVYRVDFVVRIDEINNALLNDWKYIGIEPNRYTSDTPTYSKVKITNFQITPTRVLVPYVEPKLNKKEILLNEPLRGLPNGVKDRFVKIGGKWYIERNCKEVVLDGSENWRVDSVGSSWVNHVCFTFNDSILVGNTQSTDGHGVSDKFPYYIFDKNIYNQEPTIDMYSSGWKQHYIVIQKTKLATQDVEGFKKWLQANPTTVVYQLETPTYEPLLIAPELNCYTDTTHISNNSIIPCNMKIKNSGYNTIIKPNTQYTVALDTNKSGTVGLNLGGAKVTTTNNVATITTPTTLTDDSLRVYGKGIKGKNVRLLEGNKTNWIPSMFEGMKSCFEDKDNVVELKSVNGNLFDFEEFINNTKSNSDVIVEKVENTLRIKSNNTKSWTYYSNIHLQLKPNTTYSVNVNIKPIIDGTLSTSNYHGSLGMITLLRKSTDSNIAEVHSKAPTRLFRTDDTGIIRVLFRCNTSGMDTSKEGNEFILEGFNIYEYTNTQHKSNKIQFLLKEPLRKWDRFVFVDGKLMIERGSLEFTLDDTRTWNYVSSVTVPFYECNIRDIIGLIQQDMPAYDLMCDKLQTRQIYSNNNFYGAYIVNGSVLRIRIKELANEQEYMNWLSKNPLKLTCKTTLEPTYEEIPTELADIILECYENGTLFIDTIIPPTVSVRYSGELPMVKAVKTLNVQNDTISEDLNNNIVPYLMDMDYRLVNIQLNKPDGVVNRFILPEILSWLKRDINTRRYSNEEYLSRIVKYLGVGRISMAEYNELEELINGN